MQIENVSDTAFWVAHYRGQEGKRKDALFQDPLAEKLAGEKGAQIAQLMTRSRYTGWSVVIRTHVIDGFIQKKVEAGEVDAVVNLGAGLDTRPYRLDLPKGLPWIEVDFAPMIEFKEEKLKAEESRVALERVKIDLTKDELRREFLSQINSRFKKILVLTEGVIPYLTEIEVAALAKDLRAQSHIRFWIGEQLSPEVVKMLKKFRDKEMKNAPFQFDPPEWESFFSELGWKQEEVRYFMQVARQLKRYPPVPLWMMLMFPVIQLFSTAKQREKRMKQSAYALRVPK